MKTKLTKAARVRLKVLLLEKPDDFMQLYLDANKLVVQIGAQGEIDSHDEFVWTLMRTLDAIDDRVPIPQ